MKFQPYVTGISRSKFHGATHNERLTRQITYLGLHNASRFLLRLTAHRWCRVVKPVRHPRTLTYRSGCQLAFSCAYEWYGARGAQPPRPQPSGDRSAGLPHSDGRQMRGVTGNSWTVAPSARNNFRLLYGVWTVGSRFTFCRPTAPE